MILLNFVKTSIIMLAVLFYAGMIQLRLTEFVALFLAVFVASTTIDIVENFLISWFNPEPKPGATPHPEP